MALEIDSFGFQAASGASDAEKSKYLSCFVQLGGQAEMSDDVYVTFRNKAGIIDSSIYQQIGAAPSSFPFNGGTHPIAKACKLVSVIATGIVEEAGISDVNIDVMKLEFADGSTSYSSIRTSHIQSLTALTNGRRFNSATLSVPQTADTVFAAGDSVSLAISNVGGVGKHYLNGVSVVLTFELT